MENQPLESGDPKFNWSVIGHDWAVALLQRAVETGRQAQTYLFTGLAHIGRRVLALALARALNCTGDSPPCGLPVGSAKQDGAGEAALCRACRLIASGIHPDVRVLAPDGASIKIDQMRELQHDLALSPVEGRYRVAILDGMELATAEASNALLKTLEEPPASVALILIAPEPEVLLPTIVSRCQHLALRPLAMEQVRQALISHWSVEAGHAQRLAHLSGGRLGWAVTAAQDEAVLQKRAACLDDLLRLVREKRVGRFAYAEALAGDDAATLETLEVWQTWWRDVMLLATGSAAPLVNVDRLPELRRHAGRFGVDGARRAAVALSRTAQHIARHANTRLALEVLLLDLPRDWAGAGPAPAM